MSAARVVFISGALHRREPHQYRATNVLLARALNESKLPVEGIVVPNDGYPRDPSILDGAAAVVIFSTGHTGHPLLPKLKEFDSVMAKGTGLIVLHWSTEPAAPLYAPPPPPAMASSSSGQDATASTPTTSGAAAPSAVTGNKAQLHESEERFLAWLGGYCDPTWSVNPHWQPNFKPVSHPIWNGVNAFTARDEWYFHMRFREDLVGVTPILSDLPPSSTLRRKDGPREGNPAVRKSVGAGNTQTVAWAYQRPGGGGRGVGWTGGHYFSSWQNDDYRKVMLNAIVWAANMDVPPGGVPSQAPQPQQQKQPQQQPPQQPRPDTSNRPPPRVLVVGASRGIGLELAKAYADHGAIVSATARGDVPALTGLIKGGGELFELDVRNQSHVQTIAARLEAAGAAIDVLIHNAGVKVGAEADVMDINGEAPFRLISAVLPAVLRSQRKQVVVITSDRGMSRFQGEVKRNRCSGDPGCLYTKSKMLANTKFRELEPGWKEKGITAIAVHPGWTKTDMSPTAKQTASFSANAIRNICEKLLPEESGRFYNYDGKTLKW